ncbi:MAG: twin transmembrane helix small protein [Gammaproteobacteria bacterium]|nr:twin transmembrane helix small protein [Gammaproteobacteria bacterium]
MGALEIVVIFALIATVGAMVLGLWSMGKGGSFDRQISVHFMYARIALQGLAVLLMLLALYIGTD